MPRKLSFLFGLWVAITACAQAAPSVADSGVVVWKLDSPASIGGHAAKVLGAPHLEHDAAGSYATFNGVSDGFIVPANPVAGLTAFTVEVLFRPDAQGSSAQRFFYIEDTEDNRLTLETRLTEKGGWVLDAFLKSKGDSRTLRSINLPHSTGDWYWAATRYDGHVMTSFVNGRKELSGPVKFTPMTAGNTAIGTRIDRTYWFKGAIRELRFHPQALPDEALQRAP